MEVRMMSAAVLIMTILAGCRDVVGIPGTVVGSYGGTGVQLDATTTSVQMDFLCNKAVSRVPLVIDDNGRFNLVVVVGTSGESVAVLSGVAKGDTISFTSTSLAQQGIVRSYVAVKGRAPDFNNTPCTV